MQPPEPRAARLFPGLDLLRFVSAFSVLISHYDDFFNDALPGLAAPLDKEALPLHRVLAPFYLEGSFAVRVFWAISGFIFFHRYAASIRSGRVRLREYALNRFSRLYPVHLLTLIAVLVLQEIYRAAHAGFFTHRNIDAFHFLLNLLMIPVWGYQRGSSFNAPVWSVSVEEVTYLSFFLIAATFSFGGRHIPALLLCCAILVSSDVMGRFFGECLGLFLLGGALCLGSEPLVSLNRRTRGAVLATAAAVASALLALRVLDWPAAWPTPSSATRLWASHGLFLPALLIVFVLLMPNEARTGPERAAASVGRLTYSAYMIHFPLQLLLVLSTDALGLPRAIYYRRSMLLGFVGLVFALGALCHQRFERPLQTYLRARLR
jgi:peptidoglycan/LPS O-acetylase OafA/YrhL